MKKHTAAATLTIRGAARFSPKGLRDVAAWLRRNADDLEQAHYEYAERFTARYLYRPYDKPKKLR